MSNARFSSIVLYIVAFILLALFVIAVIYAGMNLSERYSPFNEIADNNAVQAQGIETIAATDETIEQRCYGFNPAVDNIVSANYCLDDGYYNDNDAIVQDVPYGFEAINIIANIDGERNAQSQRAKIQCDISTCTFYLTDGNVGINGQWGYKQELYVQDGCYLIKATGNGRINDPLASNRNNYSIQFLVNGEIVPGDFIRYVGSFDVSTAVRLERGNIEFGALVSVAYHTPGIGSEVDLHGIGLMVVPDLWCIK